MKRPLRQTFSLLMVFVLLLSFMPAVFAETEAGEQLQEDAEVIDATPEELEYWAQLANQLPEAIAVDGAYPYGIPQDTFFPGEFLTEDSGIMPMAAKEDIPPEMYDSMILRALAYTGYDVDYLKAHDALYSRDTLASRLYNMDTGKGYQTDVNHKILSNITYGAGSTGLETVKDSSTVSGYAPNIAKFEEGGLVCASFVAYYIGNYLPNIEGIDTSHIIDAVGAVGSSPNYAWVPNWKTGLDNLADIDGSGITKYTNETEAMEHLVPGDIIVFKEVKEGSSDSGYPHIAIYAGTMDVYTLSGSFSGRYNLIIHVGNRRGPEISVDQFMASTDANGNKSGSAPYRWYHLDINDVIDPMGIIEIYKEDQDGAALAGAKFKAVHGESGDTFYIGPTDEKGYAKSGELPLGTYTVTETVFPDGYTASGDSSWTVTLTKDTPNLSITIRAVNKLITGGLTIQKATNTGKSLGGWQFGVYTDSACTKHIAGSPFTTPASGKIEVTGLIPGTYYVKELSNINYWITDDKVEAVNVTQDSNETVTFTNTHYGKGKIVKQTNTGANLSGWKFQVCTDITMTKPVEGSPFTTDNSGTIVTDLMPGIYFVREVDESETKPDWDFDSTLHTLVITPGNISTVTATNTHYGHAKIVKRTNTGKNLGGWKFNIYTDASRTQLVEGSPFVTNDQGIIDVRLLPGTYWVQEVDESASKANWSFDTSVRQITVTAGSTATVQYTNHQKGVGRIVKKTNTAKNLAGWKFQICTDAAMTQPVEGSPFTTNAFGQISTYLVPGIYYVMEVQESEAKPDWDFDGTVYMLTVTAGSTSTVTANNTHYGYAKILKQTNTGQDLGGWKFNIYSSNMVEDSKGNTVAEKGDLMDGSPFTTDSDGVILARLLPGTYFVEEVEESAVHPDWLYDPTVHQVTVTAGSTVTVSYTNHQRGQVKIIKTTPDGGTVAGWVFEVYQADTLVGTYTSGEDGTILTDYLLPGEYTVKEILPEDSIYWCESENPQTVLVESGKVAELTFTNRLKPGKIAIQKVDITGEALPGAEFLLEWSADGTNWQPVVHTDSQYVSAGTCTSPALWDGKLRSDKSGMAEFTGLHPEMYYRLTETAAPEGYLLLSEPAFEGKLPTEGELTVELTVVNVREFMLPSTGSYAFFVWLLAMTVTWGLFLFHPNPGRKE